MIKKALFFLVIIFFLQINLTGVNMSIDTDQSLKNLQNALPQKWKIIINEKFFILEKDEEIYVLSENRINAPVKKETQSEKILKYKKYGKKIKPAISFRYEPVWSDQKLKENKTHNEMIQKKLDELSINFFSDNKKTAKNPTKPLPDKQYEEYEKQKTEIEKNLIPFPDFTTSKYYLFFAGNTVLDDEHHSVYPKTILEEIVKIKNLLKNFCLISGDIERWKNAHQN